MKREDSRGQDKLYPKPELSDLMTLQTSLQAEWSDFHEQVNRNQDMRYQRDETPKKWKRHLEGDVRIRSRLTHNEILRVVANQTRNPYRVDVPPSGSTDGDAKRAKKQTRWSNGLMTAFERKAGKPLRRPFVDAQNADGLVAWELCLTDAYDGIDLDYREVTEEKDGQTFQRPERDSEWVKRTEKEILQAGMPFTLRMIEARSLFYREDDDGICKAMIIEYKPYQQVYNKLEDSLSYEKLHAMKLPEPGTRGWPTSGVTSGFANDADGIVETIRYYDRRWYAYIVGGTIVDGPREHGLPGVPVFPCLGIVTSSPNLTERMEGITWGMHDLEQAINDLLTLGVDVSYTYSRPHPVIETAVDGDMMVDPVSKKPAVLDLSDPRKVRQLGKGQKVVDAFANFEPRLNETVLSSIMNLWQRNGMNPIAQGQSPGADPAGYTVNTMIGAANALYEVCLDNEARTWEQVCNFARKTVRDTIEERVYLSVPMEDKREGGVEWLGLGPDDVDETPCVVTIDPMGDQNRLAERQTLENAWMKGLIPRSMVQQRGYGIDDPQVADDEILRDKAMEQLYPMLVQMAMTRLQMMITPPAPQGGGVPEENAPPPGAAPAPPNQPTIGAQANEASQGQDSGVVSRAMAGQNRGYEPPVGGNRPSEAR